MIKPYLLFSGDCEKAFLLYKEAFDGEIVTIQKYGEMPPDPSFPITEEQKNLVLHTQLKLNEIGSIMGADATWPVQQGTNISISLEMTSEDAAIKAWNILKDGGEVEMDLAPTFFAKLHGSLKDKFGFLWMFTVE